MNVTVAPEVTSVSFESNPVSTHHTADTQLVPLRPIRGEGPSYTLFGFGGEIKILTRVSEVSL
jgi:hypothetical protein